MDITEVKKLLFHRKQTPTYWKKTFTSQNCWNSFSPRQYREPLKVNNSTTNSTTIWQNMCQSNCLKQMVHKHLKRCSTASANRYMQIKTTVRYLFTLHKYGCNKKQVINVKKNVKKWEPSCKLEWRKATTQLLSKVVGSQSLKLLNSHQERMYSS